MLTGKGLALVDEAAPPVWLGIGDCIVVASDGLQSLAEEEIRRSPARRSRTHAAATPPRRCRHRAFVVQLGPEPGHGVRVDRRAPAPVVDAPSAPPSPRSARRLDELMSVLQRGDRPELSRLGWSLDSDHATR